MTVSVRMHSDGVRITKTENCIVKEIALEADDVKIVLAELEAWVAVTEEGVVKLSPMSEAPANV